MSPITVVINGVHYQPLAPIPAYDQSFSELISQARASLDWTFDEAAKAIGCGRSSIYEWEIGRMEPSLRNLLKISEAYGIATDRLIGAMRRTIETEKGATA